MQLADIAIATAESTRVLINAEPAVALLSFSTKGSGKGPMVDKVVEAMQIVQARAPELNVDGELQADAAVDLMVGKSKAPGSKVAGRANTLVFPEPGIGQHRLQTGGAAGRRDGHRTVPAGAGEAGQRSFARLLGGGYLQCGGRDGAAIGDGLTAHGPCCLSGWSTTNATICTSASTSFPPRSTAGCTTACCAPASPRPRISSSREPATDDDVRLVHDAEWVAKLRSGTLSYQDILRLEIPYSRQMVEAFWLAAGGTDSGGAAGAPGRHRIQYRRRLSSRVSGPRRGLLRDQRYRDRGPPPAARRRDPARHGGGLRRAPRQRHRGDLRGRSIGLHALDSPVQQLSQREAALQPGHSPGGRHRRRRVSAPPGQRLSRGAGHVPAGTGDLCGGRRSVSAKTSWAASR